jgi:hypothetical protein
MSGKRYINIGLLIVIGSILVGTAPIVLGMIQAFSSLQSGASEIDGIETAVRDGLLLTMVALPFVGVGLVFVFIGLLKPGIPKPKGIDEGWSPEISSTGKRE